MSFVRFETDDSVVSNEIITAPLWTGGAYTLNSGSFFSSSVQENTVSGDFYLNVYQLAYTASGSEVQFGIAYGHISGSGSAPFNYSIEEKTPTRAVYGQFRNMVYGDEGSVFNFGGNNGNVRDIFALSVNRARFKESINVGSFNMKLTVGSASLYLTDDSNNSTVTSFIAGNKVYNVVSGSNGRSYNSSSVQTNSGSYGLFFPDMGVVILNPRALALPYISGGINMSVNETSSPSYSSSVSINNKTLFSAFRNTGSFSLKSQETISSRYFFVNAKSSQFNYTTNPSVIDNNGNLIYSTLIDTPQTYISTIGLYNNSNELLAVAKLSRPLVKDFVKQFTARVKLEF